jgi:hypothetical protein
LNKPKERRPKRGFWRTCRIYFRRFRIAAWLVILLLLVVLIYLNQVGLPGFVKRPLLEKLRGQGIDLQFSRLRLRFYRGIVAENVRFGRAEDPLSPRLALAEVQVQLNHQALRHLQIQVDALRLRRGRFVWPLAETNGALKELSVENLQCELRFLPGDQWALDDLRAGFAGANIQLSGVISHASSLRQWRLFEGGPPAPAGAWDERLRRIADTLERVHFPSPPQLQVQIQGDARDPRSFEARLMLRAPGANTPWGDLAGGYCNVRLHPADADGLSRATVNLEAASAQTRWATLTNFHLRILLHASDRQTNLVTAELKFSAAQVHTDWATGRRALLTAQWVHAITNPVPLSGQARLQCESAQTRWGEAGQFEFDAQLALATNLPASPDPSWGWWTNLQPFVLQWAGRLSGLRSPQLEASEVSGGGNWSAPRLALTNLHAGLYRGRLDARASLDVATRVLQASLASDFDAQRLAPLLPESAQRWLGQFEYDSPPRVNGDLALVLPPWTQPGPDWTAAVLPTLRLSGEATAEHGGSYRKVAVSSVHTHFNYTNSCWSLPDLLITRPEGRLEAVHRASDRTADFYWRINSTLDPGILRPLLETDERNALDLLTFTEPPHITAEIQGCYHKPEVVSIEGRVTLTNFTFRGQQADFLQAGLQYSNLLLQVFEPRARIGAQDLRADGLAADFQAQRIYLTNGVGFTDPMLVARAIGPHVARTVEPYHFDNPVNARVHGTIPMQGDTGADLYFDIDGGSFHWWKFTVPHVAGRLHWVEDSLTMTNVAVDFYSGKAAGWAAFNFPPKQPTEFQFGVHTTNTLLRALMADLNPGTNHLEGILDGTLVVTRANTEDWRSVFGYGNFNLRDGLIWDIPLFGRLTPWLNEISPGLGSSRVTAGSCAFLITNGVMASDNLDLRATATRLDYRGTVDLEGRLNARVTAEPLREMPLFGPLISYIIWPVTKLFECKVSGTLADPKTELVYLLPKLIFMPLHPIKTLKGLVPESSGSSTNFSPVAPGRAD